MLWGIELRVFFLDFRVDLPGHVSTRHDTPNGTRTLRRDGGTGTPGGTEKHKPGQHAVMRRFEPVSVSERTVSLIRTMVRVLPDYDHLDATQRGQIGPGIYILRCRGR